MRKLLIMIFLLAPLAVIHGDEKGGLILSGVDTLNTKNQKGFDFITQKCCTISIDMAPYTCVNHFLINAYLSVNKYLLSLWPNNQDGPAYLINMGKMNLDSIKGAPTDSTFLKQPNGHGDDIPFDSLSSRIGNVYLIKTAPDQRPAWSGVYFVKMKILGFDVIDSVKHQIKMRFLWACQLSNGRDLATSGLDTFHLEPSTLNQPSNQLARRVNHSSNNQYVFKVVGDRFVLPQDLVGKVKYLTVWDLRGRMVGRIEVGNESGSVDLNRFAKFLAGISVMKLER